MLSPLFFSSCFVFLRFFILLILCFLLFLLFSFAVLLIFSCLFVFLLFFILLISCFLLFLLFSCFIVFLCLFLPLVFSLLFFSFSLSFYSPCFFFLFILYLFSAFFTSSFGVARPFRRFSPIVSAVLFCNEVFASVDRFDFYFSAIKLRQTAVCAADFHVVTHHKSRFWLSPFSIAENGRCGKPAD